MSTQTTHPEQQEGEVYWINISTSGRLRRWLEFRRIQWKTKRLGEKAFDIHGKPLPRYRPVFVQESELSNAGIEPDWREKSSLQRRRGEYQV